MKIGVFDSGIGGLNVLKEILKKYPNNTYYYYGDTKNIPYGDKDKKTLFKLAIKIIHFFENLDVDLIIIACGTISSNCYNDLKKITNIKILDVLSPTFNYIKKNKFKNMSVFATKRTIESHIFKKELGSILEIPTPELVSMVENNLVDNAIIQKYIEKIKNRDVLILGCTHYPSLISEFKKYLNINTKIIDMGEVLSSTLELKNDSESKVYLYFSKVDDRLKDNIKKILGTDYSINLIESI